MEDLYLYLAMGALLVVQVGCFFAGRPWIRRIPTLINVALMAFCVVMYALSGCTNWGYLILLFLLFLLLVAMGILWLIYGIVRKMRKQGR
jgi:hypothetical protein